jgi:hypothetical protein
MVMQAKTSGTRVEVDAAAGDSGKAEIVKIQARTGIELYAQGNIDIRADGQLILQGRLVRDFSEADI